MIKKITFVFYVVLIVVMAAATIIEHLNSTPFVSQYIYGAWWFSLLWALLVAVGVVYIAKSHLRKWNLLLLHLSMIVILVGAFLTHTTGFKGMIHLRGDQPTNVYTEMVSMSESRTHRLPFSVRLDHFDIQYHDGTQAASDYMTHFVITDGETITRATVSMNKVFYYHGTRFYQASYDTDNRGSYLSVNSDPYGLPVTYTGYGLLFFSLLWLLVDAKGTFRQLLRSPVLKKSLATLLLIFGFSTAIHAAEESISAPVVAQPVAEKFGDLYINYNERICPLQTFALDFVKKIYGKRSYKGADATQILMSWIFFGDAWNREPIVQIKSKEMRETFGLPEYTNVKAFFQNGEYVLGQYAYDYQQGQQDALHKACYDMDNKLQVIMSLQKGTPLALFPHTFRHGKTQWFSPFEQYPKQLPKNDILLIKSYFPALYQAVAANDEANAIQLIEQLRSYQQHNAGESLPTDMQFKAEKCYNNIPFSTLLFILNLCLGFFTMGLVIRRLTSSKTQLLGLRPSILHGLLILLLVISFSALTFALALRWIISDNIPLSNGYESMLSVAWFSLLITIVMAFAMRSLRLLIITFGFLLSGFFLLVSHIGQMDPAIGHIMPVLNSPLLSVHVSIIMMSYALLALTFICGLTALILSALQRMRGCPQTGLEQSTALMTLSRIFLYPAMTTLGLGIFIGAIWANISWGNYWSWDPKETWALITFMVYAVLLHLQSVPALRTPKYYHIYTTIAFLTIVITYFGVNYVLGGMHSYA